MDALALLRRAHAAGLRVSLDSDKLLVRGPRAAEPVATALLDRKAEIVAVLTSPQSIAEAEVALAAHLAARGPQPRRCGWCGCQTWWTPGWGGQLCAQCHPDPRLVVP